MWNTLSSMDKERVIGLRVQMDLDPDFKAWMQENWKALHEDIEKETGYYPYFYSKIEEEYEEYKEGK